MNAAYIQQATAAYSAKNQIITDAIQASVKAEQTNQASMMSDMEATSSNVKVSNQAAFAPRM